MNANRSAVQVLALALASLVSGFVVPTLADANRALYHVLHAFTDPPDGDWLFSSVVADAQGNLYGAATSGGAGQGTIYKLEPGGSLSVLHTFSGPDGAYPSSDLFVDEAGDLFGATDGGGDQLCNCGVIFKISAKGKFSLLYKFKGGIDGEGPGPVIEDSQGNLYGATVVGGQYGEGAVFQLAPNGTKKVLYAFSGNADGAGPRGGLVQDATGNLYGTTELGGALCDTDHGSTCGVVYKLSTRGVETVLHTFTGGSDGAHPGAALVFDQAGDLYGTTEGGLGRYCGQCGHGTVFKIAPDGTYLVIHAFAAGDDGDSPLGSVTFDRSGSYLYGTTYAGGNGLCKKLGCGTIFQISPNGTESILHKFITGSGANPHAGLFRAKNRYFGTASVGGAGCPGNSFCGVVFEFAPPK